ncbi:MAG: lysylphosphatidylglycerol synthase transmembrane domain-containing protein [Candidatus Moraniibacteriota bacterium]
MDYKKLLKFVLKLIVSLFFVWWIIFQVNWNEVLVYLKKITVLEVALYVALYLGGMFFSAYKWQFLARLRGVSLPLGEFFKTYFTATFINNFMPSFVGGDSFKIYHIGKLSNKFKAVTSSVIMDRLTGLIGGMMLVIIFAVLNFRVVLENKILLTLSGLTVAGLLGVFLFLGIYRQREFNSPFGKLNLFLNKLIQELGHYNGEKKHIGKVLGFSFLFNLFGLAGANGVLFWALDIQIGILNYLSVIFLASVVSSIPISINNIGVKEWAYITFFGIFGLGAPAVISVAIISRTIQMLLSFLAIPIYLKEKKL